MLVGAFFGVAGLYWTESAWAGLALAVVAATALSLLFGLWVIKLGGDAIIVGLAVNLLAVGLTAYLTLPVFGVQGSFDDPSLQGLPKLWGFSPLVYLGALLVPATGGCCSSHPFGVRLRAVGEDAEAAAEAGIDPDRMKFAACAICGVLCGLAGAQLALSLVTQWVQGMTAGRGFIALVAIMLARSHPIGVGLAAAAVRVRLRAGGAAAGHGIPPQFVAMLPYVLTIARARAARAARARARCGHRMRRVVLDMDVGIDDAIAIALLAAREDAEVVALGSVHGNCSVEDSTRNALVVLEAAGSATCRWRAAPRSRWRCRCTSRASSTARTGSATSASPRPRARRPASTPPTSSSGSGASSPGELDLLAVGPLTNLGLALQRDPRGARALPLGGDHGRLGPVPGRRRAARVRRQHRPRPATPRGWCSRAAPGARDGGRQRHEPAILDEDAIAALAGADMPRRGWSRAILPFYLGFYRHKWGRRICSMHDPLAAGILADPCYVTAGSRAPSTSSTTARSPARG